MLRLSDTSVRLYRKGDGRVSVRWRGHFMIGTNTGFRLSTYLHQFELSVAIVNGPLVQLSDYGYSDTCVYELGHMVHEAWAAGTTSMPVMSDTVALLRLVYRLFSFPGQGDPSVIEQVVPVLARGTAEQQFGRRYRHVA